LAFAHVFADGTVDTTQSKNVISSNISHSPGQGSYCFNGLSFMPNNAVVTLDANSGPAFVRVALNVTFGFTGCASLANQAAVIFNAPLDPISRPDSAFYILFN
jgi:hypothetical protein